jgi:uncharacterized SAM-binding protein YcdF (DUF218 family)
MIRRLFQSIGLLSALWGAGFLLFMITMPRQTPDSTTCVDGVVVLTGGEGRVSTGFQLVEKGLAKKLFITGVNKSVTLKHLKDKQHVSPDATVDVALGYAAGNTRGNAHEATEWIKANNVQSIRLVTADYHMRRSVREFRTALPGIHIIPHPVSLPRSLNVATMRLYLREYHKYLRAWVRSF